MTHLSSIVDDTRPVANPLLPSPTRLGPYLIVSSSQGFDLGHIFQLRVPEHAHAIIERANDARIVVVGSSFIGMEAAAALIAKVCLPCLSTR